MAGIPLAELAKTLGGTIANGSGELRVTGVANPDTAGDGDLVFLVEEKYRAAVEASQATMVVARAPVAGKVSLVVASPREAMARALAFFVPAPPAPGVHPSAVVDPDARLGERVHLGPHVWVGPGAVVGDRSVLRAGVRLYDGARLGADCVLHAGVVVREGCRIGDRVVVQPGAVIGADGYGFVAAADGTHRKMPQIGLVEVQDDVEIGSNVTIDRATIGATVIGRGTKIDNLVHVGHNVRIGENVLLVAQVGLSGSVTIEDGVVLAGQVGVVGHLTIGQGAVVASKSGVTKTLPGKGMYSGFPARPHREELRRQAQLDTVGELAARVKALQAEVAALKATGR